MHRPAVVSLFLFVAAASAQSQGQPTSPTNAKGDTPTETKLSGDALTLAQAKAVVAAHQVEKAKIETARQAVFKQGAKATPEERARLIADFRKAQQASLNKVQAEAARVRDLEEKIKVTEKTATPSNPTPAPKS